MTNASSVVLAQELLAAITLTYGSAFLGLWLQYRRDAMRAFALAWLGLGAYSALTVVQQLAAARQPGIGAGGTALTALVLVDGVATALALVNASYTVVDPSRSRRGLWRVGSVVAAGLLALLVFGLDHETPMRLVVVAALASAMIVALRASQSPGRRSMIAALALLLLRPFFGLLAASWTPGTQPAWYTILQLFVTMTAGFLATVAVFSIERDAAVRERASFERGLSQAQRMDSMGRMASSVAHDFNNILTSVLAASESVAGEDVTPRERAEAESDISAAVQRGKELTQRLLTFSRPGPTAAAEFDPARRLRDLVPMIERLVGYQSPVACIVSDALRDAPVLVRADPVQFDQLMLNLAANARDAMPDGGTLTIRCAAEDASRAHRPTPLDAVRHLRIDVSDTGSGMSRETAERVFDPYFTTKDPGKGTGLGLASAFAFVRQSGGLIRVESAEGKGSTFTIHLPVAGHAVDAAVTP